MADSDRLTKAENRAFYRRTIKSIKEALKWPHRLRLTCTGRGKHPENVLAEIWVDKTTGDYALNRFAATRNVSNRMNNRKFDHVEPYVFGKHPEEYGEDEQDTLELVKNIEGGPSWFADRIRCHRCKMDVRRNKADLSEAYLEFAWANMTTIPVDYLDDVLRMMRLAQAERDERVQARGNERGDRPHKTSKKQVWVDYATSKGLDVDGMTKQQVIATVQYYGL